MLPQSISPFHTRILQEIKSSGLEFPGLDDQAILARVVPTAEDWIIMQIVTHHLSTEDQVFFRDAIVHSSDIFDPAEFLFDTLPDFDALVDSYFEKWISNFSKNLSK